jgi:hypothetical protein
MTKKNHFSHIRNVFHGQPLPETGGMLAGYSALIETYQLKVPLPDQLSAISKKHKIYQKNNWHMFTPRHAPHDSLFGHLTFALKYEGINLSILKALFNVVDAEDILNIVNAEPTGSYSRRIWFLYEWLQGTKLKLADAVKGNIINVLDVALQYPGPPRLSKRHRVQNNLPGVPNFCPTIRKTPVIDKLIELNLHERARIVLGAVHPDVLNRAAAFMLLKDSKASFAIENETPPQTRAERWGQAIAQAGMHTLSDDEFLRLQQIIISDFRFMHLGYRSEGGFVGEHERSTGAPIPEHISARPQDLYTLMNGLIETNTLLTESSMDAILAAAIIAFGFVFIHPFEDGNGRVHRYLIHHVLAEKKFTLADIIFPVSFVILERIAEYRKVLEAYSRPRLAFVEWRPTEKGNVEVLNDTIDLYRYFDATKQAEFLYECIKETIEKTLPEEVDYLKRYDELKQFIKNQVDMPDRLIDLLIRFLSKGNGVLSKRARSKEFSSLTKDEIEMLQKKYTEIFCAN